MRVLVIGGTGFIGHRLLGQALGEDPARAIGARAAEPPCPHLDGDDAPRPGQVGQGAGVVAVDPAGKAAAERAGALGWRGRGDNGDAVGCGQNLHDRQTCRDQRQNTTGQRRKSGLCGCPSPMALRRQAFHQAAPELRMNPNRDPPGFAAYRFEIAGESWLGAESHPASSRHSR